MGNIEMESLFVLAVSCPPGVWWSPFEYSPSLTLSKGGEQNVLYINNVCLQWEPESHRTALKLRYRFNSIVLDITDGSLFSIGGYFQEDMGQHFPKLLPGEDANVSTISSGAHILFKIITQTIKSYTYTLGDVTQDSLGGVCFHDNVNPQVVPQVDLGDSDRQVSP